MKTSAPSQQQNSQNIIYIYIYNVNINVYSNRLFYIMILILL